MTGSSEHLSERVPLAQYLDPLDAVWIATAERVGFKVVRSREAYASYDGNRTIVIGALDTLDADDSLAQLLFHELCHSMLQGTSSFESRDWGLDAASNRDEVSERACLRMQAALAARWGLQKVLAPTTELRAFYDEVCHAPLSPDADESVVLARQGLSRVYRRPWAPHIARALTATATIGRAVVDAGGADVGSEDRPSLWRFMEPV